MRCKNGRKNMEVSKAEKHGGVKWHKNLEVLNGRKTLRCKMTEKLGNLKWQKNLEVLNGRKTRKCKMAVKHGGIIRCLKLKMHIYYLLGEGCTFPYKKHRNL